jgi:hypothetical protein
LILSLNPFDVVLEGSVVGKGLDTDAITLDLAFFLETVEIGHNVVSETELTGHEHSLATGELELGGLHSQGHKDGADGDTGSLDVRLSEGATHTLLESISTSAGEHLVDADGVPGVDTDSQVELILAGLGDHVLVGGDAGRLKRFRTDHFLLLGDEMDAAREFFPLGSLLATVKQTDLGVGHTTVVA